MELQQTMAVSKRRGSFKPARLSRRVLRMLLSTTPIESAQVTAAGLTYKCLGVSPGSLVLQIRVTVYVGELANTFLNLGMNRPGFSGDQASVAASPDQISTNNATHVLRQRHLRH